MPAAVTTPASRLERCALPVMACDLEHLCDSGRSNHRLIPFKTYRRRVQIPVAPSPHQLPRFRGGYGLGSSVSIHDGFVYHGHSGAVDGGLTELAYLPDANVGYLLKWTPQSRQ